MKPARNSCSLERCVAVVWAITYPLASAPWAVALVVVFYLASAGAVFASDGDRVETMDNALEAAMLRTMGVGEDQRDETTSITTISLGEHAVHGDLWVAHGAHDYEAIVAVFARSSNGDWGEPISRSSHGRSVRVTAINVGLAENVYFFITILAGVRNCDIEVFGFDGKEIFDVLFYQSHCSNSEIAQDLNGDGIDEMLLVDSFPVFHRLDGVFQYSAELAYWNGSSFVVVRPSLDEEFVGQNADAALVRRMIEADLWIDASQLSTKLSARARNDVSLRWLSILIERIASLNTDSVSWSSVPLLSAVLGGDYARAFEMMRANVPNMAFSAEGPLIVETTSDGLGGDVTDYLFDYTERALEVRPDDPHIHAVRALALAVDSPDDKTAGVGALERAVSLAPDVEWLRQAQSFLQGRVWDAGECVQIVSGAFAAPDTSTEVFVGRCLGDHYLQFEDGPRRVLERTDYIGNSYKCVDRHTGLDHVVLETTCLGSSCVPDHEVYLVNAESKAMERAFSIEFMDDEWLQRPLVTADGECLWRGIELAEAALDVALAPVVVGRIQAADSWHLKPEETLALSPRRLSKDVVLEAFGAIDLYGNSAMLPLYVGVLRAKYLSNAVRGGQSEGAASMEIEPKARAAFQVLQVQRHSHCGGAGVLLVEDMRDRTWIVIRDFGAADCEGGGYDESMEFLYVRDEKLYARGIGTAYEGSWFEIDLRDHTAKRLLEAPQFITDAPAGLYEENPCS